MMGDEYLPHVPNWHAGKEELLYDAVSTVNDVRSITDDNHLSRR
jgi:hypothetical protein